MDTNQPGQKADTDFTDWHGLNPCVSVKSVSFPSASIRVHSWFRLGQLSDFGLEDADSFLGLRAAKIQRGEHADDVRARRDREQPRLVQSVDHEQRRRLGVALERRDVRPQLEAEKKSHATR